MMIDMAKFNPDNLDPDELAVFKWQYSLNGDFYTALWEAIKKADDDNLDRIGYGFPIEIQGLRKYRQIESWWIEVERKAVMQPEEVK